MRQIPGFGESAGREFLYVESTNAPDLSVLVDDVFLACDTAPLPKSGGILEEMAQLILPDNTSFLAFSYKGDLQGWRGKIVAFCDNNKKKWAIIQGNELVISDGIAISLDKCDFSDRSKYHAFRFK